LNFPVDEGLTYPQAACQPLALIPSNRFGKLSQRAEQGMIMGLQNSDMAQAENAHVLVINQTCENDQLLVSLCRNNEKWLSPVGWTDQQKVTLLECRSDAGTTEIDIPAEFARDLDQGDVLSLKCSELDFEKEIIWEDSNIIPRADFAKPAAGSLKSSLLSRFISSSKRSDETDTRSEAERRADEAHRAAESYKAKMEAAASAKEDAQRKALEAARQAEEALKAEADRIAEMERAAKAFEEAERLEQDELRRVEEERLVEEARIADEARRIEEARRREERARREAERKAALERYVTALDVTQDEEKRLKDRLARLEADARDLSKRSAEQEADLIKSKESLAKKEKTAETRRTSFEKTQGNLTLMRSDLSGLQLQTEALATDKQALTMRLAQADADYIQAQKEAEDAIARADIKRKDLETVRREETDMSDRLESLTEDRDVQSRRVSDVTVKTQELQSKFETAQAAFAETSLKVEAMERGQEALGESSRTLRVEMEATQQAIEDTQAREAAHATAIAHLERGGNPEEVEGIAYDTPVLKTELEAVSSDWEDPEKPRSRFFGRKRRNFKREPDPEISIDVEDVKLEADNSENAPFPATQAEIEESVEPDIIELSDAGIDGESFFRRHNSSLIAIGAIIGGIAIIGGGFALNKTAPQKLDMKSSAPAPQQVASAVTTTEIKTPSESETPAIELPAAETTVIADPVAEISAPEIEPVPVPIEAKVETVSEAVKVAALELPAVEVPNLIAVGGSQEAAALAEASQPKAVNVPAKTVAVETPIVENKPAPARRKAVRNYPELTTDVQTRLTALGFYTGPIDGLQNTATKEAIKDYKTLYDLTVNPAISGEFLSSLKKTERLREEALTAPPLTVPVEADNLSVRDITAFQPAEAVPAIQIYDTIQSVPVTPVEAGTLPASEPYIAPAPRAEPAPVYTPPVSETEPVLTDPPTLQVASVPEIIEPTPAPIVQDVIVEAKVVKNAAARYPNRAERQGYYVNVTILVSYDIDAQGKAVNLSIASNDHSGRYNEDFENAAMRVIERSTYAPKTINGDTVISTGHTKRIRFQG